MARWGLCRVWPGAEVSEGSSGGGDAEAIADEADYMAVVGGGVDPFDDQILVFLKEGFEFGVRADFAASGGGAGGSRERALALTRFRRRNHPLPLRRAKGWRRGAGVGWGGLRDREFQIRNFRFEIEGEMGIRITSRKRVSGRGARVVVSFVWWEDRAVLLGVQRLRGLYGLYNGFSAVGLGS